MPEIFTKNDIIVFQDLKALDSFVFSLTYLRRYIRRYKGRAGPGKDGFHEEV
jgi:hypothetical protein